MSLIVSLATGAVVSGSFLVALAVYIRLVSRIHDAIDDIMYLAYAAPAEPEPEPGPAATTEKGSTP